MKTSDLMIAAVASCFVSACAQAYDTPPAGMLESSVIAAGGGGGGAGGRATDALGGVGGVPAPMGEPCLQGDVVPCPCEGAMVQGQRACMFDMSSPTQGYLSDCQGCPAPVAPDAGAPCVEPACAMPTSGAGGAGGGGGASGEGGASGAEAGGGGGGDEPTEPVDSCDGVPEGTECDRECIFPGNTAHCNARGDCSCL